MKYRYGTAGLCCLALLLNASLATAAEQMAFTFEQLVKVAFKQNLGLQIEQQQKNAEQANEGAAFRRLLPSVSINSGRSEVLQNTLDPTDEITSYSSSLVIAQPIYQPALWASWRKSELSLKRSEQALVQQQRQLFFALKQRWYNLLKEQILNQEAKNSLKRLQQHYKNAEAFFNNGKIWRNDVLQAQVRVSKGLQDVFVANNRLALAKSQINLLLNRSILLDFEPLGQLGWQPFDQPLPALLQQALTQRLELKQGQIDVELAKKDQEIAAAKRKPTVNFSISSGASSQHFGYRDPTTETVASLNMSWSLWQWGQTNQEVNAAEAKVEVKALTLQQQRASILAEVQSAYLTVMESQQSLAVSEQALKQAEENFRVSQIRYKEQLGSSNDVLDAQDLLTQTQSDRVSALARYLTAIAELDLARGAEVVF